MKFRKLRIAFSVFWGLAAVLLIMLWVRSYWWRDAVAGNFTDSQTYLVASLMGRVLLIWDNLPQPNLETFYHGSTDVSRLKRSSLLETHPKFAYGYRSTLNRHYELALPLWVFIVSSGLIAGAPWIRWKRRFSLRTLLIATTLLAVVLGLAVWAARR